MCQYFSIIILLTIILRISVGIILLVNYWVWQLWTLKCHLLTLLTSKSNSNTNDRLIDPILAECRNSLLAFHEVKMQLSYREANRAVDLLAKVGCVVKLFLFWLYLYPSNDVITILSLDPFDSDELYYLALMLIPNNNNNNNKTTTTWCL